jgi:transcription antitermination factor NusG
MKEDNWWVIRTKSKAEKKLAALLNDSGFEACCPTYTTIRQWSDRKKKVELPLISCVVFVKETGKSANDLYVFPLVVSVMKEYGKPALVRSAELESLLILCGQWEDELITQENYADYQPGDYVEVTTGKFQGMRGEMLKHQGKHKLYLTIKSLQMAFSVVLPKSQVKLIEQRQENKESSFSKSI